jgi:hypothetical protein
MTHADVPCEQERLGTAASADQAPLHEELVEALPARP